MTQYDNLDLVILKNIISNKKHALEFVNESDSKLFSTEVWNFANIIINYIKNYKELPTLKVIEERLSRGNNDKLIECIKKIWKQLEQVEIVESEYKFNLEKIKKRFAEKQLLNIHSVLSQQTSGTIDISRSLGEMQKTIQSIKNLDQVKTFERKTIKNVISQFSEKFNAKRANPQFDSGLMSGYSFFDYSTNGVRPADFIIIAGESGHGKSILLQNMAIQIWLQSNIIESLNNFTTGKNVIYFSLEMPYEDCFNRLLSRLSGVPSRKIEQPHTINKEELQKIKQALNFIKEYPYDFEIVDISDASADDIDAILNDVQYNIDAIFIDYLGIMKPNKESEEADWQKQGKIAYEIRSIARKRNLPIFSAVQLNRKSQSKEPAENIGLNRLARSATIATHATHVLQIESRLKEEMYSDFIVHIIKARKGPKVKGVLLKNLACATLIDKPLEDISTQNYFMDYDISNNVEKLDI